MPSLLGELLNYIIDPGRTVEVDVLTGYRAQRASLVIVSEAPHAPTTRWLELPARSTDPYASATNDRRLRPGEIFALLAAALRDARPYESASLSL